VPNINDVFPTKFLKAHDLKGKEPVVTIERVEFEPVGRSRDMKPVIYFAGKEKGIVLNKTNANKITEIAGSAITEEWAGIKVKLYTAEADFGGDTYDVIRIKSPNGSTRMQRMTPLPPPSKSAPPPEEDDLTTELTDDEIPF
jgi:hypothetical protein